MSKWLSDEEVGAMEDGGLGWTNGSYLHALCVQAKESNRLREGLENLHQSLRSDEAKWESDAVTHTDEEDSAYASGMAWSSAKIGRAVKKLLEGGE